MLEKRSSRRNFLGYAVTAVVVGVVAGVGGYYAGLLGVPPTTSTLTSTLERTETLTTTVGPGTAITSTTTVTSPTTVTRTATVTTTVTPTAPKPDKIVVMTWGGPAADNVPKAISAFTKQYEVPGVLELQAMSSEGLAKIQSQWPKVDIDVFSTIPAVCVMAKDGGYLAPLDENEIPNLRDVPDNLKITIDGKVYGVPAWYNCTLWQWNTETYPKGLRGINDLLDPSLKGRIGAQTITSYAGGFVIQLAYARGGSERNMEPGWEFMKELVEGGYIRTVSKADAEITDSLLRGEVWTAWTTTANLRRMQGQGGPIEANKIYPDSKTAMDPAVWCIVDGPRKEWAAKFLNTLLEPEVLLSIIQEMKTMPSNKRTTVPAEIEKYILTPAEAEEHGYFVDPVYQAKTFPQWQERWEKDILPLLG